MKLICALTALAAALVLSGCATQRGFPPEHQIVNFDNVDQVLYRGAQPNHNGLQFLAASGVKTIICLREVGDTFPAERETVESLGMKFIQEPMSGTSAPSQDQMDRILTHIAAAPGPVFIHCQFGCDRTGTVVACWRIRHDHWQPEAALKEAKDFGLSPLLPHFHSFIKNFK